MDEDRAENMASCPAVGRSAVGSVQMNSPQTPSDTWHLHNHGPRLLNADMSAITSFVALQSGSCAVPPELSILPIHGGDNEACVSGMTFIMAVV